MSILIKGMEMPKNCENCFFCGYDSEREAWCAVLHKPVYPFMDSLPDVCPLIEIPPHGDLIDRDALLRSIKESIEECHKWADEVEGGEMYARVSQSLGTFVECSLRAKAAPTIIEAERGEI